MFYLKKTVDRKLFFIEKRISKLETENERLKEVLRKQGINPDLWLSRTYRVNIQTLADDLILLLDYLKLEIRNIPKSRELMEKVEDDS